MVELGILARQNGLAIFCYARQYCLLSWQIGWRKFLSTYKS